MDFDIDMAVALLEREVVDYDVPVVDLIAAQTGDPFKVLVATILSARTRDEVTAAASRRLFARADSLEALAELSVADLEKIIYPVGFFRNKAGYLANLTQAIEEKFSGRIPETIKELVQLPGVGRKTANLVLALAFDRPAICVDTHVHRIMNIWGVVQTSTPLKTEMELRRVLLEKYWIRINSLLVAFAQEICKSRSPHCDRCLLNNLCPQIGVTPRRVPGESLKSKLGGKDMFMVSWNVNGLRAVLKKGFLDVLHEFNPDIFAIQEIKAMPDQLPEEVKNIPGYHIYWYPAIKKGYSGTAVFSRIKPKNVLYGFGIDEFDSEGRTLTLEFDDFFLINCYFPNAQHGLKRLDFKQRFNNEIQLFMEKLSEKKSVVLCGDLNVAHREIDLANPQANRKNPGFSPQERDWMDELMQAGFEDSFRMFNQEPENYTWWSYRFNARARNIGWRIDYFLVDPGSRERVKGAGIHDDINGSDHCPVSLRFE